MHFSYPSLDGVQAVFQALGFQGHVSGLDPFLGMLDQR